MSLKRYIHYASHVWLIGGTNWIIYDFFFFKKSLLSRCFCYYTQPYVSFQLFCQCWHFLSSIDIVVSSTDPGVWRLTCYSLQLYALLCSPALCCKTARFQHSLELYFFPSSPSVPFHLIRHWWVTYSASVVPQICLHFNLRQAFNTSSCKRLSSLCPF